MTASIHVIHPDIATPKQVLADATAKADTLADVIVIGTDIDGRMRLAYANCGPEALALAALYLQAQAVRLMQE